MDSARDFDQYLCKNERVKEKIPTHKPNTGQEKVEF